MQFMLMLYGDESGGADVSPDDFDRMMAAYEALDREMEAAGVLVAGAALEPTSTATTVRVRGDEPALSDGPFAETREQLGGFYLIECRGLDDALAWAAKVPAAADGAVEVRPVMPT